MKNNFYRKDIDGLRAIAIMSVVGFHFFPAWIPGGFIGVDIFFVISGYLISGIIFKNLSDNKFSFLDFYIRRIKRIFPSLILVMVVSFIVGWFVLLPVEYESLSKELFAGTLFSANFLFWSQFGYFDAGGGTKPFLHLWSLGIEEQFYIIWPIIIFFAWKKNFNIISISLVLFFMSFIINVIYVDKHPSSVFYFPITRFWELLVGAILSYIHIHIKLNDNNLMQRINFNLAQFVYEKPSEINIQNITSNTFSILGFVFIILGIFMIDKELKFPGYWALLPIIGTIFIIAAGSCSLLNRTILSNKFVVWFGLISYPLYLWHWPLFSFMYIVEGQMPSFTIRVILICLSIFLAFLTYKFYEYPIRFSNNKYTIKILVIFMLLITFISYFTYTHKGYENRNSIKEIALINNQFTPWRYVQNSLCQSKYKLNGSDEYGWWFCMQSQDKKPTLLLLGNSFSNHLYPGFINNQNLSHHNILSIGTCDPAWVEFVKDKDKEVSYSPCSGNRPYDQMLHINKIIENEKSITHTIISGIELSEDSTYIDDIKKRINFLEKNNIKVIIFLPHLRIPYDIKSCYNRPFGKDIKNTCIISNDYYLDFLNKSKLFIEKINKDYPNVIFYDPNELFCVDDKCSFKLANNLPAFRDQYAHFSEYASNKVVDNFVKFIKDKDETIFNLQKIQK